MVSNDAQSNKNSNSGDARSLGSTLTLEDTGLEEFPEDQWQQRTEQLKITEKLLRATLALTEVLQALGALGNQAALPDVNQGVDFYDEVCRFQATLITQALELTRGNKKQAAALLGLNASTLHAMIKRYNIGENL